MLKTPPPWLKYVLLFGGIALALWAAFGTEVERATKLPRQSIRWPELTLGMLSSLFGLSYFLVGKRRILGVMTAIITLLAMSAGFIWVIYNTKSRMWPGDFVGMSFFGLLICTILLGHNVSRLFRENLVENDPVAEARELVANRMFDEAQQKLEDAIFEYPQRANEIQALLKELDLWRQRQTQMKLNKYKT
jgi:peptidoglycan/LPS O-acetylase OafA/YrhL